MVTVADVDPAGNPSGSPAGNPRRRRYDSSARRQRAAEARRRILEAAADLFSDQGYGATTLQQIAQRAGVTAKLVIANGPKAALLLAAFELRVAGAEGGGPQKARRSAEEILAEPDPSTLVQSLADFAMEGQQRGIGLWRALTAAAAEDPMAREAYQEAARGRAEVMGLGIALLADRGLLRPGDRDRQTATLALLLGFDPYQLMVLDWGWTPEQLRQWLVDIIAATLVDVGPE